MLTRIALILTSSFFILGGLGHLFNPSFFIQIMPTYLPWHKELVFISGLCELAGGVLIWIKPIRVWIGIGLIALCVFVFPANVYMAMNPSSFSSIPTWLLYVRLPAQGLIILVIYLAFRPAKRQLN